MKRIATANRALDLFGAGKDGFKQAVAGVSNATYLSALLMNHVQEAVIRTIERAGLPLSDTDFDQFPDAIQKLIEARVGDYSVDTGVANAYVIAMNPPVQAYYDGMPFQFRVAHAGTGASTLTAGGAVRPLVRDDGLPVQDGDLPLGAIVSGNYVAATTSFQINSLVLSQTMTPAQADGRYLTPAAGDLRYVLASAGSDRVGEVVDWPYPNAKPKGLLCNGAAVSSTVYAALFAKAVKYLTGVTITIASPAVVSWAAHPLYINAPIKFTSTGALPTGLVAGTTYYVMAAGYSANTFQISATIGGAAIIASGAQSGVHTAIHAVHGCANDLSTFNVPNVPAGYTTVQAASNEGAATVGEVLSHTHSGAYMRSDGGSNSGPGAGGPVNPGGVINYSGGPANLAAGLYVRKYILFA